MHEEKVATGLNIPRDIIQIIDQRRGRISRSTYVTILLERLLLKGRKTRTV